MPPHHLSPSLSLSRMLCLFSLHVTEFHLHDAYPSPRAWFPVPTTSICPAPKRRGEEGFDGGDRLAVLLQITIHACQAIRQGQVKLRSRSPRPSVQLWRLTKCARLFRYLRNALPAQTSLRAPMPPSVSLPRMFHGHENIAQTLLLASIPR